MTREAGRDWLPTLQVEGKQEISNPPSSKEQGRVERERDGWDARTSPSTKHTKSSCVNRSSNLARSANLLWLDKICVCAVPLPYQILIALSRDMRLALFSVFDAKTQ